jgi:hypothetical protein
MASVFPDFERDGFFLHNAVKLAELYPSTYLIPSSERRHALRVGDIVKLSFRFRSPHAPDDMYDTERMWVIVRERMGDHWVGVLDNDPKYNAKIASGHPVHFHPDHVIDIWED